MRQRVTETPRTEAAEATSPRLGRRSMLAAGGGVAGLAAAAAVLPGASPSPTADAKSTDQAGQADGRYQLTEHVKRYYQTTRV
jgi:hypothetical protein